MLSLRKPTASGSTAPRLKRRAWWLVAFALLVALGLGLSALLTFRGGPAQAITDGAAGYAPMRWQMQSGPETASQAGPAPTAGLRPEAALKLILADLQQGQRSHALARSEQLVRDYPHFQLGHLLHAELLNAELPEALQARAESGKAKPATAAPRGPGAVGHAGAGTDPLEALASEARRRLRHTPAEQLQGRLPKGLLHIGPAHRYVAAVDAAASRLYWFVNDATDPAGQPRLRLLMSTYVSVGANGVGKFREGDARTPLGVYFVQRNLPGERLPDLYGVGALTLNYPNAIDLMRNKTGSGIWLHGTPSLHYSRAPLATDGCVVLANPDMQALLDLPDTTATPVLIAQQLDWVDADAPHTPAEFANTLQAWLRERHRGSPQALAGFYSPRFERDALGLDHWWPRLARQYSEADRVPPLQLQAALAWHDEEDLIVATLAPTMPARTDARGKGKHASVRSGLVRTYWRLEAGRWKIVYEGPA